MNHIGWSLARFVALVSALVMFASACGTGRSEGPNMKLRVLDGKARIIRGEKAQTISSEMAVTTGDVISLSSSSSAELRLARGRTFELIGSEVEILSPSRLILRRGNLLADVTAHAEVGIETARVESGRGAFRVDRALASRVGTYKGTARISGNGDRLKVPQLRQAVVAGGIIPSIAQPLRLSAADRWDRRYLDAVIELDTRLTNFGRGLEAQLGDASGISFFSVVAPVGTDVSFLTPYLDNRRSDLLIGLMIAIRAANPSNNLANRFSEVLSLWKLDASWGLIAYEYGASGNDLFTSLIEAIGRAGLVVVGQTGGPGLRRPRPAASPKSKPTNGPKTNPSNGTTTSPSPTGAGLPSQVPGPVREPVDSVVCGLLNACNP